MPNVTLPITIEPIVEWATWAFDQIDQPLYLLIGMGLAFVLARGILAIFGNYPGRQ